MLKLTIQWLMRHVQVMLNSFESEPVHETVCGVGIGKESLIYYVSVFLWATCSSLVPRPSSHSLHLFH